MKKITSLLTLLLILQLPVIARSTPPQDEYYSVTIAVNMNENKHLLGRLEYTDRKQLFPLQLVLFSSVAGRTYVEPYVYELLQKTIIEPSFHQIKCRALNNPYDGYVLSGSIDFRNKFKPKIILVREDGQKYITNISSQSEMIKSELIPDMWLGF